ncbi:MAG TPA: nucleotidyltransferase domain-containing protein [Bacteroidales bacterium]|nr:nucleotidyltransferase domain-containing protein [Lentimicrobiaceae bacterium]HOI01129.1 nucleotidyltransferase domain-containing protein [Bacteroidales bacterium]
MFGLSENYIVNICRCFEKYQGIKRVIIYGSRARGDYKRSSDIDLAIVGSLTYSELMHLEGQLDDLLLPYKIDIGLLDEIENPDLRAQIRQTGQIFYDAVTNLILQEPSANRLQPDNSEPEQD